MKAQQASKKTMQVGSQRVGSVVYQKARELYKAGEIGKLNMINAVYDRQSALGAWKYTMQTDASPETVDWDRYLAGTKKYPGILKIFLVVQLPRLWNRRGRRFIRTSSLRHTCHHGFPGAH